MDKYTQRYMYISNSDGQQQKNEKPNLTKT